MFPLKNLARKELTLQGSKLSGKMGACTLPPGAPFTNTVSLKSQHVSNVSIVKCDEITYPFPYFNICSDEVWEWIINVTSHFTEHVITYPYWN